MLPPILRHVVFLLVFVGAIVGFLASPEPKVFNFIHDIGLGIALSGSFYLLVVELPECRRRIRLRHNLQQQYDTFRLRCIEQFLMVNAEWTKHFSKPQELEELLFKKEFYRYFCTLYEGDYQDRWQVVMKTMRNKEASNLETYVFNELYILRENILYVLNNVDIHDQEVFAFLQNLSHILLSIKDDIGSRPDFQPLLFQMFTGWNRITGVRERDIIQSMIERI